MSMYEKISEYYERIFPLKKGKITFLESLLTKENQKILDIGCATGELALALSSKGGRLPQPMRGPEVQSQTGLKEKFVSSANFHRVLVKGHRVIGIDLDKNMVNMARSKAKNEGAKSQFYVKDMLDVGKDFSENSFDTVLCLGNTLVHLKNLHEIGDLVKEIFSILKRDGIFILQVVNFERVLTGQIDKLPLLENDTFTIERKYQYDKNRHLVMFKTSLFLKKSGESVKSNQLLYPLIFEELKPVLAAAGFSGIRFFENESRVPFTRNSPALICIARKK